MGFKPRTIETRESVASVSEQRTDDEPERVSANDVQPTSPDDSFEVGFEIDTATAAVEEFIERNGAREPLPTGAAYFGLVPTDDQRRRVSTLLARMLVQQVLQGMALNGELGDTARRQARRLVEIDGQVRLGALGYLRGGS